MKITTNFDAKHNFKAQTTSMRTVKEGLSLVNSTSLSFQGANNTKNFLGTFVKKLKNIINRTSAKRTKEKDYRPRRAGVIKCKMPVREQKNIKAGITIRDGSKIVIENPFYNDFQKATKMNNRSGWACMNLKIEDSMCNYQRKKTQMNK